MLVGSRFQEEAPAEDVPAEEGAEEEGGNTFIKALLAPFQFMIDFFWQVSGLQDLWLTTLTMTQGLLVMSLMAQRDTIAKWEGKLVPILATVWLAL